MVNLTYNFLCFLIVWLLWWSTWTSLSLFLLLGLFSKNIQFVGYHKDIILSVNNLNVHFIKISVTVFIILIFMYIKQKSKNRKYSATCAIRHLSFPTSCDIRQKFLVQNISEYSNILHIVTHFPDPLVCRIWQVSL